MHVREVKRGDSIWVENHWGEFEKHPVIGVETYRISIPRQRFSKASGWEVSHGLNDELFKSKTRHRHRIHNGDGILYTDEYVASYRRKQQAMAQQTEAIYTLLNTSPVLWRRLTMEQLSQIQEWLHERP